MSLFDQAPIEEIINVRIDSHDGSNQEKCWCVINKSKGNAVESSGDRSEQDCDVWANEPHQTEDESVVIEEFLAIDEGLGLLKYSLNVLHNDIVGKYYQQIITIWSSWTEYNVTVLIFLMFLRFLIIVF